jgi:large subunit ribosomal protein L9
MLKMTIKQENLGRINMKVILLQDVKKLGKKDQTVEVSDGYAQNFLFPRRLAVQVTQKSREILSNQQENARLEEEKNRQAAKELAEVLKDKTLVFKVKSGKEGKMFGSVSLKQVEEEMLKQHKITIDKRKFLDKGPLDCLGVHKLKIELFKNVIGVINVHIQEEGK